MAVSKGAHGKNKIVDLAAWALLRKCTGSMRVQNTKLYVEFMYILCI